MHTASARQLALPGRGGGRRGAAAALTALAAALVLALAFACPGAALAGTQVAHVEGSDAETFDDPWKAWDAAKQGKVIVMDADWDIGAQMTVPSSTSVTIKMNGYKVSRNYVAVDEGCSFWLETNSTLTLDGSDSPKSEFYIKGYISYGVTAPVAIVAGGLVNGGYSLNSAGGVQMNAGSTLNLIDVALAGNMAALGYGGGVEMDGEGCKLNMTRSSIMYSIAEQGGGVSVNNANSSITMTASSITYNRADQGGGIYSDSQNTVITMKEGSVVDYNTATSTYGGGGVYLNSKNFHVLGDGSASISHNVAAYDFGGGISTANSSGGEVMGVTFEGNASSSEKGGAVYADSSDMAISQCTFKDNSSKKDGGAIYGAGNGMKVIDCAFTGNKTEAKGGAIFLDHSGCLIQRCTFTDNAATGSGSMGGAIYNENSSNKVEDCRITGNTATAEGGGIYTTCNYNLEVAGVLRVYGNTRGGADSGNPDDVFLNSNDVSGGGSVDGHLTGDVSASSWIGIRTSAKGEYKVNKNIASYTSGTYFMDLSDSFHLEYDAGGDTLKQVPGAREYSVKLNGVNLLTDADPGDPIEVNGDHATLTQGKAFWCWDVESSTGMPGATGIADAFNPHLEFDMPANDISLVDKYVPYLSFAVIELGAPVVGEDLPAMASVSYNDEAGKEHTVMFAVAWSAQDAQGTYVDVTGKAEYGTTYQAVIAVARDFATGLVPGKLTAGDVKVYMGDAADHEPALVSAVEGDGSLAVTTKGYATPARRITAVEAPAEVSVPSGITAAQLAAALPGSAAATAEDGSEVELELEDASAQGYDWSRSGILDEQGRVAEPAADERSHTYELALRVAGCAAGEVSVPEALSSVPVRVTVGHADRTVTFDPANGGGGASVSVAWGSRAAAPADPSWEGHDFLGWYAEGADEPFDFAAPVTENVVLTARWAADVYEVTFDVAGGSPAPAAQSVEWGKTVEEPVAPVREHYVFEGWFAEGSDAAWDFATPVSGPVALAARWVGNPQTVTFDPANGEAPFAASAAYGSPVADPGAPERAGYAFLGWYDAGGSAWDFSAGVTGDLALTARWSSTAPASFADVEAGSWYEGWVAQAAGLGLMTGYKDGYGSYTGLFGPGDTLTRGQVATVLYRLAGSPAPSASGAFADVDPGAYYADAVDWCAGEGVVTGYQAGPYAGMFLPGREVTREELAAMVWRFARRAGVATSGAPEGNFGRCEDAGLVSAWARDASVWCAAAGVVTGKETAEGTYRLDPRQAATRAQAAKVFVRLQALCSGREQPYLAGQADGGAAAQAGAQAADESAATFDDVAVFGAVEQPAGDPAEDETPGATEPAAEAAGATEVSGPADGADADASFDAVGLDQAA